MKTATKSQLTADLNELLAGSVTKSAGRAIADIVRRLQLWDASPSELRGIGDAGLSDDVLNAVLSFGSAMVGDSYAWSVYTDVSDHLWARYEEEAAA